MKTKYIHERLDGTTSFPDCPQTIKSKEDLIRWFEHTDLPEEYIKEATDREIKILFPRCKFTASAIFSGNECYRILL